MLTRPIFHRHRLDQVSERAGFILQEWAYKQSSWLGELTLSDLPCQPSPQCPDFEVGSNECLITILYLMTTLETLWNSTTIIRLDCEIIKHTWKPWKTANGYHKWSEVFLLNTLAKARSQGKFITHPRRSIFPNLTVNNLFWIKACCSVSLKTNQFRKGYFKAHQPFLDD